MRGTTATIDKLPLEFLSHAQELGFGAMLHDWHAISRPLLRALLTALGASFGRDSFGVENMRMKLHLTVVSIGSDGALSAQ
jgi:hypothetical protein